MKNLEFWKEKYWKAEQDLGNMYVRLRIDERVMASRAFTRTARQHGYKLNRNTNAKGKTKARRKLKGRLTYLQVKMIAHTRSAMLRKEIERINKTKIEYYKSMIEKLGVDFATTIVRPNRVFREPNRP